MIQQVNAEGVAKRRRGFLASALTLLSGVMAAQGVSLLSIPLLTRVYSPVDFAVLALVSAIITVVMTFATGRFEFALLVCDDDRERGQILTLGFLLGLLTTIMGGLVCLLLWWLDLENVPVPAAWLGLMPALLLVCGCASICSQYQIALGRFRLVASAEVCMVLVVTISQLGFGVVLGPRSDFLVLGILLGRLSALLIVCRGVPRFLWRQIPKIHQLGLWETAVRYRRFPTFTTLFEMVAAASNEMPAFVLRLWFPTQALGFYSLAMRVLEKPVQLVNKAVAPVVLRRVSEIRDQHKQIDQLMLRTFAWLFLFISPAAVLLVCFASPLFEFAFGPEWSEAGLYAQLLTPLLVARFATLPCWTGLIGRGKPQLMLMWTVVHLVVTTSVMLVLVPWQDAHLLILAFSLAGAMSHLLLLKINRWAGRGAEHEGQVPQTRKIAKPQGAVGAVGVSRNPDAAAA